MDIHRTRPIQRGDIFLTDLGPIRAADRRGVLPVLILRGDPADFIIVAADIKRRPKRRPKHAARSTYVRLQGAACGLFGSSAVLLDRFRILDRDQLGAFMGSIGEDKMREVETALHIRMGLINA